MAMQNYTQHYAYDEVGNILQLQHSASTTGSYTRDYTYNNSNNRLSSTKVGSDTYTYGYHAAHGFINSIPHLTVLEWNFKEEIAATSTQSVGSGTPETTYYQYDSQGTRLRKITENYASIGNTPTLKQERIYIAGWELYKEHSGASAGLTCTTLSLIDEGNRFVMIETTDDPSNGISTVTRYQHPNHQGSTTLETDEYGNVITYEEYHPFGTTSYQATNGSVTAAAKRYRYTGMERDDETGLEYHNARYYISWLGRWMNCDPIGIGDGVNVYAYCRNNPVGNVDSSGTQLEKPEKRNETDNTYVYTGSNIESKNKPKEVSEAISFKLVIDNSKAPAGAKNFKEVNVNNSISYRDVINDDFFGSMIISMVQNKLIEKGSTINLTYKGQNTPIEGSDEKFFYKYNLNFNYKNNKVSIPIEVGGNNIVHFSGSQPIDYIFGLVGTGAYSQLVKSSVVNNVKKQIASYFNNEVQNISLGLENKGQLARFSDSFENAPWSNEWKKFGLISDEKAFDVTFENVMNKVVSSGGRIKFDLTNFDIKKALDSKGKGLYDPGVGYTDWEFNQIMSNENWLNSTDFYISGKKINFDL